MVIHQLNYLLGIWRVVRCECYATTIFESQLEWIACYMQVPSTGRQIAGRDRFPAEAPAK